MWLSFEYLLKIMCRDIKHTITPKVITVIRSKIKQINIIMSIDRVEHSLFALSLVYLGK